MRNILTASDKDKFVFATNKQKGKTMTKIYAVKDIFLPAILSGREIFS